MNRGRKDFLKLNIQRKNFCFPFYLNSIQSNIPLLAHENISTGLRRKKVGGEFWIK
jgi:hypothetical protein